MCAHTYVHTYMRARAIHIHAYEWQDMLRASLASCVYNSGYIRRARMLCGRVQLVFAPSRVGHLVLHRRTCSVNPVQPLYLSLPLSFFPFLSPSFPLLLSLFPAPIQPLAAAKPPNPGLARASLDSFSVFLENGGSPRGWNCIFCNPNTFLTHLLALCPSDFCGRKEKFY